MEIELVLKYLHTSVPPLKGELGIIASSLKDQRSFIMVPPALQVALFGAMAYASPHPQRDFEDDSFSAITSTRLAIDATITDYRSWLSSMNSAYSTSGVSLSGTDRVFVHTTLETYPGGSFTGYFTYDAHALTEAGYAIITETTTSTSCSPETTPTLPPSPTGSDCSPHGDHCW